MHKHKLDVTILDTNGKEWKFENMNVYLVREEGVLKLRDEKVIHNFVLANILSYSTVIHEDPNEEV